ALPRPLELRLGALLGRTALALGAFKDRVAAENIGRALPELSAAERRRLLEANYEHMGRLFFEYLHFFTPLAGHYARYAAANSRISGLEHWEAARAKGKGVLIVSLHLGWWEMQAAAGGLGGMALTVVTKAVKPAWLHDLLTARRLSTGVKAALHPGSMPSIMRALRKGEAVAFMNDQYARPPMGLKVRFFGVEVETLSAVGPLSKRTGAAIITATSYRDLDGITRVFLSPELDLGPALEDPVRATQALAAVVEGNVRRHPEQWLWLHRRFKNVVWPAEPAPSQGAVHGL
ncbi:MAG: Lauroyl/myristoyl acyltransferase, partial [Elusimicrobia bacterium]